MSSDPRYLFALGGDGTLSEVVDGVLRAGRQVSLGLLPGGSGNSYLLALGPNDLENAVARVCKGMELKVDAAAALCGEPLIHRRYFLNGFGLGFLADAVMFANKHTKAFGKLAYLAAAPFCLSDVCNRPLRITVWNDGVQRTVECKVVTLVVMNAPYLGGHLPASPSSQVADGKFELLALRDAGVWDVIRLLPKLVMGWHVGDRSLLEMVGERFRFESPAASSEGMLFVDGETFGVLPCEVKVLPRALTLLA
jgi:diacylglycerol kinase (ATP)